MSVPQGFFYSKNHEWVVLEDGVATVGITDFSQRQISDLQFVELPETGAVFAAGDEAAVVESVKAAVDVYAPVAGEVIEVNNVLETAPERINQDAFGEGWLFRLKVSNDDDIHNLMDADSYEALCPEG